MSAKPDRKSYEVPEGKVALNTHVSADEGNWLKLRAKREMRTVTEILRELIRKDMSGAVR